MGEGKRVGCSVWRGKTNKIRGKTSFVHRKPGGEPEDGFKEN